MATTSVSMSEARASLADLLDRVEGGEEVLITRHGRVVAALTEPGRTFGRRAQTAEVDALVDLVWNAVRPAIVVADATQTEAILDRAGVPIEFGLELEQDVERGRNDRTPGAR